MSILDDGKRLLTRLQATRPWRAWSRYGDARGNVLAGGISYFAFFSIFPAVALAFTVFGFVLQNRPDLLQAVADGLQQYLPGFVKDAQHPNGIIPVTGAGHQRAHHRRAGVLCCPGAGRPGLDRRDARRHPGGLRGGGRHRATS